MSKIHAHKQNKHNTKYRTTLKENKKKQNAKINNKTHGGLGWIGLTPPTDLEFCVSRVPRERYDVTDVFDARGEHHQPFEAQPETGMLDGTVSPKDEMHKNKKTSSDSTMGLACRS